MARSSGKSGRFYVWEPTGERYWSVTTILKAMPKDGLIGWAAKETALYAIEEHEFLGTVLERDRNDETGEIEHRFDRFDRPQSQGARAAYDLLTSARYERKRSKGDIGSEVHEVIEALVTDAPMPDVTDDAEPYVDAFLRWVDEFDPVFLLAEAPVYNRRHRYAGTLDLIAKITTGDTLLLDVKTGYVGEETALQLAAYRHAEFVAGPDYREYPLPEVDGAAALKLDVDDQGRGYYRLLPVETSDRVLRTFLYVREVYRFVNGWGKDVVGNPIRAPRRITSEDRSLEEAGDLGVIELTDGQRRGLEVLVASSEEGVTVRRSNRTEEDPAAPTVHGTVASKLLELRLCQEIDAGGEYLELTEAGRKLAEEVLS